MRIHFERKVIQLKLRFGQKSANMYEIENSSKKDTNSGVSRNHAAALFFYQHVFHTKQKRHWVQLPIRYISDQIEGEQKL